MEKNSISANLQDNIEYMNQTLAVNVNFDVIYRVIKVADKDACLYMIDGLCKDDLLQKLLQYFMDLKAEDFPADMHGLSKQFTPYVEVSIENQFETILTGLLSGMFVLFIDGFAKALVIDSRTYPARSVEEPDKHKVLRGSKDGFVETIVFNTALIRRRIRNENLRMEMMSVGQSSKTDVVICYMEGRANQEYLNTIREKIRSIQVDALTMNQESLAECLYKKKWYNPFPKFKYTERPDVASAQVLEGNIVILVDTSPTAMILPTTIFDIIDEADDYYFPPITGTYLRLARFFIALLTLLMTPTFLLLINRPEWIPQSFEFINLREPPNIPLIYQFLILELAIDGLKLAAVNTPNMLSTPLSVMAALVLGEFSVNSGWFSSEVMLYMAFVAIANYTQQNYELGYALKFFRIILLVFTQLFSIWGYLVGLVGCLLALIFNRTIFNNSYLYPLIPFQWKELKRVLFRPKLK